MPAPSRLPKVRPSGPSRSPRRRPEQAGSRSYRPVPGPTLIVVPVLGRPHRVRPLVESIEAATVDPHRVLFVASDGDDEEIDELEAAGVEYLICDEPGTYVRKVNLAYRESTEPLLFNAADDLQFHPGWLRAAAAKLGGKVRVVGTNDSTTGTGNPRVARGRHATHCLIDRRYIDEESGAVDEPGVVFHPGYPHAYCDDEFVQTAQIRERWSFARDSIVEHLHPHFGTGVVDDTYILGEAGNVEGHRIYQARRHLWRTKRTAAPNPTRKVRPLVDITVLTTSVPERADLLSDAVRSVEAQTVTPAGHLVYVDSRREGPAAGRNRLLAVADSTWVAFLDDDDVLLPTHLSTLVDAAGTADVVIPFCRFDGPPLPRGYANVPYDRETLRAHGIFPITVLARRQAVLDAGAFDPADRYEDWTLWNRMADAGSEFVVVPEVTWRYRTDHGGDRRTFAPRH